MAFISSAKHSNRNKDGNTACDPTARTNVPTASASVATISQDTACAYIASQSSSSQIKFEDINQIDKDDMEEMDIKWNMALLSMRADKFWKKTGKKISIQGSNVVGFDKSKVKCFNCHKMGHFAREYRAPRSQDRGRRDNYKHGSKTEEQAPKALMAIDGVFDNSLCSKDCKKNNDSLNSKITDLNDKLFDSKNMIYHYKLGLAQVESRLVEYKEREVKYYEKIRTLEFRTESNNECIDILKKKLETLKQEKEEVDGKLAGLLAASKDLDNLIKSQRTDKNKEGLGYSVVPPPLAQIYSSPKKDLSWTSLLEFADDTVTNYSRPSPTMESTSSDDQNRNPFVSETVASPITPKPFIKFVKPKDSQSKSKTDETETPKKPPVKKRVKKRFTPKPVAHRPYTPPVRPVRTNMNGARPNRTSFNKQAHSYVNRPFHRTSACSSQNNIDDKGYWDSGCSRHITGNISYLFDYEPFDGGYVSFGQGGCKITGKGTIKTECIVLERDFKLLDDVNILLRTPRQHNMYSTNLNNIVPHRDLTCLVAKASADECVLWHRRLGHLNFKTMNKLVTHNLVRGLPTTCFENDHTCTACLKGKQHKASCKSKLVNSVTKPLHTLHMDLFGPTSDEISGILKKFITEIESLKDLKVKIIRCDNGGEFKNKEMNDFCSQKGMKREFSNARTPQQNSVAERRNRRLIEAARIMLADAKLPVTFWPEVVNTVCYVQNRVLVNKSHNKTLYELFNGRSLAIGFLKPFGCHVMILNTLDNLGKFEEKGDESYFIGYSMSSIAFRVLNKRTKRVEENLHLEFLENKAIEKGAGPNWLFDMDSLTKSMNYVPVDAGSRNPNPTASTSNPPTDPMEILTVESSIPIVSLPVPTVYSTNSQEPSGDASLISKRVANQEETPSLDNILSLTNRFEDILRVTTNSKESNGVEADISNMETTITASPTPTLRIYKDHPKKPKKIFDSLQDPSWVEAMTKWVLKNKKDERGIVIRNKARLVAQGHTQEEWIDYDEVFAPIARIEAIRIILAYASFMGFTVYQMDVKSAFLYGTIDEEVYVMQPTGFQDPEFLTKVYKVEKAMYGLHQAPRAWYGTLSKYMLKNGFQRGTIDQTLFIRRQRGDFIIVQFYVDDIIFGSSNP
nr:hypothetical protein [Tanacetum cinerariifolium]